ncbi:MAG: RNA polymerase sigma factor [Parcubacteria group bacterium]|nr:RNA polymerase sigma factor [Parcubacteria group bacterium]
MSTKLKEKLLLFRLKLKKNPDAFGELYDIYHNRIYRFILFKVSNSEEAQDITSEAFLRAWQHISQDKPITNLNALLYSISRNLVIDHYRKESRFESAPSEILEIIPGAGAEQIIKGIDIKGDIKKISEAMTKINEQYSEVIVLRFVEGLSSSETAEIIGCSNGNVRVMQHRALTALRKELTGL